MKHKKIVEDSMVQEPGTLSSRLEHLEKDFCALYEAMSLAVEKLEKEIEVVLLKENLEIVKNESASLELNFSPLELLIQKHKTDLMSLRDRIVSITKRVAI